VIAPFWTDIDLRGTDGVVYLGHYTRYYAEQPVSSQAAEVFNEVQYLAGDTGFLPTEVVIVTWRNVSPYFYYYYYYYYYYGNYQSRVSGNAGFKCTQFIQPPKPLLCYFAIPCLVIQCLAILIVRHFYVQHFYQPVTF